MNWLDVEVKRSYRDEKVVGQGHSKTKYCQKSFVEKCAFPVKAYCSMVV